jgi:hypothetical protein
MQSNRCHPSYRNLHHAHPMLVLVVSCVLVHRTSIMLDNRYEFELCPKELIYSRQRSLEMATSHKFEGAKAHWKRQRFLKTFKEIQRLL